ncbi:MAG: Type 1 glutamine amidotransferase-like domain-containing protein [Byssovorax sp.]
MRAPTAPDSATEVLGQALQPIFLFADSQLLFARDEDGPFLRRAIEGLDRPPHQLKAAYLGASNGDVPDYFEIFEGAMDGIGIVNCRMIKSAPSAVDRAFLAEADVILLAGGDIARGWTVFEQTGMRRTIVERYGQGAVLIGISAGAVQLGQRGFSEGGEAPFDTFQLVPLIVDVHDEPSWTRLHTVVRAMPDHARGLGIPLGGGAIVHADLSVEPVRKQLLELHLTEGELKTSLLLPT